ncbi:hypothetical protein Lwal_0038 [Legionella waltersii]|uniref:Uncharacterized protein n=1 Tax=Legionella waltersii TaxID=66969 RepID=A0A0W1AP87_9GAMM|nr:hypothetical protein Lwal_0038 [Legionella waltersii]SNU96825.1 Uncharacterised protein [Legionella waltersii]
MPLLQMRKLNCIECLKKNSWKMQDICLLGNNFMSLQHKYVLNKPVTKLIIKFSAKPWNLIFHHLPLSYLFDKNLQNLLHQGIPFDLQIALR